MPTVFVMAACGLPSDMPPLVISGQLSRDGREPAWLQGRDHDGVQNRVVGGWELVVADLASGVATFAADASS